MITLPEGFDTALFVTELASIGVYLVGVALLFLAYTIIIKAFKK